MGEERVAIVLHAFEDLAWAIPVFAIGNLLLQEGKTMRSKQKQALSVSNTANYNVWLFIYIKVTAYYMTSSDKIQSLIGLKVFNRAEMYIYLPDLLIIG